MIYLSGSITDWTKRRESKNKDRFSRKAQELRDLGLEVYNPPEDEPEDHDWSWYLAYDIDWIYKNKPKILYLMSGWQKSRGAKLELEVALRLGMKIVYEEL